MNNKLRIGTINWDSILPKSTYFGGYAVRNLGNEKYKSRLHYSTLLNNGEYDFPPRTQQEYDRELEYAIDGGIDFFVYCWYPDTFEERKIWSENEAYEYLVPHYHELNTVRKLYQSSALNKKINMCAIIFSCTAYAHSDIEKLRDAMKQPYYEKIDGRPLLIIFGGYKKDFVYDLKKYFTIDSVEPYIALADGSGLEYSSLPCPGIDAVTAYASGNGASDFSELSLKCHKENHNRLSYKLPVIPQMTMGWNPTPRIDNPCPWVEYKNIKYAGTPNLKNIEEGFSLLNDFILTNSEFANTNHALVFAWNEFEEGGYLCPTINDDGSVNDSIIKDFAKVRKKY